MKSVKEAVPAETEAIRRRVRRAVAELRIDGEDGKYIINQLDLIDARLDVMHEAGYNRREF